MMKEETHLIIIEVLATTVENLSRKSNKHENENYRQAAVISRLDEDVITLAGKLSIRDAEIARLKEHNDVLQNLHQHIKFTLSMKPDETGIGERIRALIGQVKEREAEANSYRELYNGLLKSVDGMSKNELISLNNDRNLAIKLQVESEAKASKLNAEKLKLMSIVQEYRKNTVKGVANLIYQQYKAWQREQAAKRKKVTG